MNTDPSTLTGAYAADALSDAERTEFEAHLTGCADCAREVRELRETVSRLGAAESTTPPEGLRERVLAEVSRTRQDPPRAEEPSHIGRAPSARRAPGPWVTRLAVAASVIALALAGVFGGVALNTQQELSEARQRIEQGAGHGAEMARLLQASDARIVNASTGGASATVVVSDTLDQALFLGSGLPQLPDNRTYQLWFMHDGTNPVPAGLLRQDHGGSPAPVLAAMPEDANQMGITNEPAGGSRQPSTEPIMMMNLRT